MIMIVTMMVIMMMMLTVIMMLRAWAAPWIMQVGKYDGDLDHDSDNDGDHGVEHNGCRLHFHMNGAIVLMPILITWILEQVIDCKDFKTVKIVKLQRL